MKLAVSAEVEEAVLSRVRSGVYGSPEEVLTLALALLEWAEGDPVGRRHLARLRTGAGGEQDTRPAMSTVDVRPPAARRGRLPPLTRRKRR